MNSVVESLECRRFLNAIILNPVPDQNVAVGAAPTVIDLAGRYDNTDVSGTVVKLHTSAGDLFVDLFDSQKPASVANFLTYLNEGAYNNTVFHSAGRLDGDNGAAREFLGAGGYVLPDVRHISTHAAIADELTTNGVISNVRGTVAFDTSSGPNSATSDFFVNLSTDSGYIAARDAASTVFGRIVNGSISVADSLAATPIYSFPGTVFQSLPLVGFDPLAQTLPSDSNFLMLDSASVVPEFTLAVSSDNAALATPSLSGNSLTLNFAPGITGVANVTVSLSSIDGGVAQDTFAVSVGQPEDSSTTVIIGAALRSVSYADADGTIAKITLSKGTAAIKFTGSGVAQSAIGTKATVTGSGLVISTIDLSDTAGKGVLTVTGAGGDKQIEVGAITSAQAVGISGKIVNLTGSSALTGGASSITLNSLAGLTVAGSVNVLKAVSGLGNLSISGDVRAISLTSLNGDLSISGHAAGVKIPTINGNLTLNGALSSGVFGGVTGNIQAGSIRSLVGTTLAGNLSVAGTATSIRLTSGITGNTTIGGTANSLRLGNVVGNITVNGAARSITLLSIANGLVNVGSIGGTSLTFTTGTAIDVGLASAIPIGTLKAAAWTNTGGDLETISAPTLGKLAIAGDFAPNLTLAGRAGLRTLSSASVKGQIAGGTWNITGDVAAIVAGSIAGAWNEAITGKLSSFKTGGNLSSNLDAGSIGAATILGNLLGNVTTRASFDPKTTTLAKLFVGGAMANAFVQSSGNIGAIVAGSMSGTHIFAGAAPEAGNLPTGLGEFLSPARIAAVTVKRSTTTTFSDSTIAATNLGSLNLGTILGFSNAGQPFGVAGDVIAGVIAQTRATPFSARKLSDPTQSITTADFIVRVL